MGILGRCTGGGRKHGLLDPIVLSVVAEWLSAPETGQDVQSLVQEFCSLPRISRFAEVREAVVVDITKANAEYQPATREVIQRCRHPGQMPGTPAGESA